MRLPVPVLAWVLLLAGHGSVLSAPIPAALEAPARWAALISAIASLALSAALGGRGWAGGFRARVPRSAEACLGLAAVLFCGVALGAEADRAAWPLPVHPPGTPVELEGELLDTTAIDADPPALTLMARSVRVGARTAACRARLLLVWSRDGAAPDWALPGLRVRVGGRYRPPEDTRNPGGSAPGVWLLRAGLAGVVDVDPRTAVLEGPGVAAGPGALLRHAIARVLDGALSAPTAALARGMILGDRSGIAAAVRDAFRDAGTIHILSISGLHVCLLAGIVAFAAAAMRLPRAAGAAVELGALWGYVALVGAPPPAMRSAILWTALRAGRLAGRTVRPLTAWGLAGLLLHLAEPSTPSDPGFALSFAAVLGLSVASGLGPRTGKPRPPGIRALAGTASAHALALAIQTVGAEAATLGIQSGLFGAIPVAGLILNLAIVPICALFMAELVLFLIGAALVPPVASWAAGAVEATGLAQIWLARLGAHLCPPWPVRIEPSWAAVVGGLGALLLAAGWRESRRLDPRARRSSRWASLAALALAWALPLWPRSGAPASARRGEPLIEFLDVGQGDAALALFPDGTAMLVDAGPADERRDAGRGAVEPALRAEGIDRIGTTLLSHAHLDHHGGLRWLARRGWIGSLYENGSDRDGAWRHDLAGGLHAAGGRFAPLARDTVLRVGAGASLAVSARPRMLSDDAGANAAENDRSLVATLSAGGCRVLFSGDVEEGGERALLAGLERVDVLKVPHHGSRTSSTPAWIGALKPRVAVISCGERNRFGHPDPLTVGRYLLSGARVLRTDQEGAIRITLAPEGLWISTRRSPGPELVGAADAPAARAAGDVASRESP